MPNRFRGFSRGFTLFTALIAFILIVLTMLLVQSMVSTERSYSETVSDISNQEEMQAIADLTRADALQVFNFSIRQSIESYTTSKKSGCTANCLPEEKYILFPSSVSDWEGMRKAFVKDRFGVGEGASNNQFAIFAARSLISMLSKASDARGFHIEIRNPDEAGTSLLLKETFQKQDTGFFEVIGCDEGKYAECIGTFYVTMDLSPARIEEEKYEKFPRVVVENTLTGRKLDEPILPRGSFRIYVPLRLFKALAGAKAIACGPGGAGGFFSADLKDAAKNSGSRTAAETLVNARVNALLSGLPDEDNGFRLLKVESAGTATAFSSTTIVGGAPQEKVTGYEVTVFFKETDPKYIVSGADPNTNTYAVNLQTQVDSPDVSC